LISNRASCGQRAEAWPIFNTVTYKQALSLGHLNQTLQTG